VGNEEKAAILLLTTNLNVLENDYSMFSPSPFRVYFLPYICIAEDKPNGRTWLQPAFYTTHNAAKDNISDRSIRGLFYVFPLSL
jgi:hypothetical protein